MGNTALLTSNLVNYRTIIFNQENHCDKYKKAREGISYEPLLYFSAKQSSANKRRRSFSVQVSFPRRKARNCRRVIHLRKFKSASGQKAWKMEQQHETIGDGDGDSQTKKISRALQVLLELGLSGNARDTPHFSLKWSLSCLFPDKPQVTLNKGNSFGSRNWILSPRVNRLFGSCQNRKIQVVYWFWLVLKF